MYNGSGFQVRPQTSQAVHPGLGLGPVHQGQGHTMGGRAASMHQSQLLSLIAGSGGPQGLMPAAGPPIPMGVYPPMYRPMGAHPGPQPQPLQHPMALRGAPMAMPPYNMYPAQQQQPLAPIYDLPPGAVNSNLLSILNGRPATAAGNPASAFH